MGHNVEALVLTPGGAAAATRQGSVVRRACYSARLPRPFLTLLVVECESSLPGRAFGEMRIPGVHWNPNARRHGFVE